MAGQNANTDQFDAYFKRADLDGDGQISGAEAVAFFQGSGLPKPVLAQVWTYSDQKKVGYLSRQEFYNALKLVTVAQRKRELTPEIVKAALYGPASTKIPAPQISLAATPAPNVVAPAAQLAGITLATSQPVGVRPPQLPGNASTNQQYFPSQQNEFMRPPQAMPPSSASHPQQVLASQTMPKEGIMAASPPNSNISNDWLGGSTSATTTQIPNKGINPAVTQGVFGLPATGLTTSVQPRPHASGGQPSSTPQKLQDTVMAPNQSAASDPKAVVVSENGFASDSLFGDVFSATSDQLNPSSSSAASSASSLPVSAAIVPSSVGPQSSAKPSPLDSLPSTFQPVGDQSAGKQNQQVATQTTVPSPSARFPVAAGNSTSGQSQSPWPRMTQSDIQKYMKVFVQVDTDRDGKITGEQARNLFLSWRLPREVLKQVWDLSDQDNDSMLSLREFCFALYLMERYRGGRPLPTTLPSTLLADETLLSATNQPSALYGGGTLAPSSGWRQPQVMTGTRPTPAAAAKPPRPPSVPHTEEKQPGQQKPKVPVLEKHLVNQLSQEEQDSLNAKFQEASQADKKVEELEKEISDSRQKIEFYRTKMQELILYKSRCDNRLNEVTARVSADKREAETLAKKYEEKYKQVGDVASKLTIEEATFRDVQERKMELYRAIVKLEDGGSADGVLKERAERIQSGLEDLVKNVNERCKQYGLRAKPTSLVELPFGWQHGIQEGAADWDEEWDKFEDEGFNYVQDLTLDVKNVVAPPKTKSLVQKETTSMNGDSSSSSLNAEVKSEKVQSPGESMPQKESVHDSSKNGVASTPPDSPAGRRATESHSNESQDSPFREGTDSSPHVKEIQRSVGERGWGTFDAQYDTDSVWGFDSASVKDMDNDRYSESSIFGSGEFGLNPIRTGSSHVESTFQSKLFADSVPSTPANYQGKSSFAFDSVPSTPASNQGRSSFVFDSVPSTPAYNFGNTSRRFSEGSEDHSFDSFSRFDSFNMQDGGLFQSPRHSLSRFDSISSTRDSDGFPSRFDSFRESQETDQIHGFSRFDSFRDSDQSHGFSKFDSFRDSDQSHGFPPSFDSFRESRDFDHGHGFSRFDSFSAHDGGLFQASGSSVRGYKDSDTTHGFPSFDDTDPFGSSGPFKTSVDSETPRKSSDSWRAF